jgi:hypothetical protein
VSSLRRSDWIWLGVSLAAALAVRVVFVLRMDLPSIDPWRHLVLVRNLREGLGFTLFAGQPYLWYNPGWHQLLAALPAALPLTTLPVVLSALCVVPVYLVLRRCSSAPAGAPTTLPAACGALLIALSGPVVQFTCHFGAEAFALLLALTAVALAGRRGGWAGGLLAGLLFGVALTARLNFLFLGVLLLPALRDPRRAVALAAGAVLPLAAVWWRNHGIIAEHRFLFTWDGLATRTADFGPVSTLFLQSHPAIQEGLRRLHEQIVPVPNWIRDAGGLHVGTMLFMAGGVLALLASRRPLLILAGLLPLGYFLLFDRTLSSNFFRIDLPVFPVFFLAAAAVAGDLARRRPGSGRWAAAALVAWFTVTGGRLLEPPPRTPLELVTPPAELLTGSRYLVNSTFYHPESLLYAFPDREFVGLPLDPDQFAAFQEEFPDYRTVLWHSVSVQDELLESLQQQWGYRVTAQARNRYGRLYSVLRPPEDTGS